CGAARRTCGNASTAGAPPNAGTPRSRCATPLVPASDRRSPPAQDRCQRGQGDQPPGESHEFAGGGENKKRKFSEN
ncbi:MAG: hypothetical protein ACPIOQ_67960, partial [Promethearchaeia archaeon]